MAEYTINKQITDYTEKRKEEIIEWILDGRDIYGDDIEYVGDWVYMAVYLPQKPDW